MRAAASGPAEQGRHTDPDRRASPARLVVRPRARRVVVQTRKSAGPQALVLSWPGGATCLPANAFEPSDYDVIIGHVAGCPIHVDVRQLDYYRDRTAVLDAAPIGRKVRSVLLLRRGPAPLAR